MKGKGGSNLVASKTATPASNIPGVEVMAQAKKKGPAFKRGGAPKEGSKAEEKTESRAFEKKEDAGKKEGGEVDGMKAGGRMDKMPRKKADGGGVTNRGRSPFSNASSLEGAKSGGKSGGYC